MKYKLWGQFLPRPSVCTCSLSPLVIVIRKEKETIKKSIKIDILIKCMVK